MQAGGADHDDIAAVGVPLVAAVGLSDVANTVPPS